MSIVQTLKEQHLGMEAEKIATFLGVVGVPFMLVMIHRRVALSCDFDECFLDLYEG